MKLKASFIALAMLAGFSLNIQAQNELKTDFVIAKIEANYVKTPQFNTSLPQKRSDPRDWLEVEVEFVWQPRNPQEPKFLDELTFNYYILLSNTAVTKTQQGTLLTGQVTHVAVAAGKGMRSVMYVSPRTLDRFFDGKPPATAQQAVQDVGITITKQGQLVAFKPMKGKGQWWNGFQQTTGYVMNKSETPFAPLFWDYYEAIKSRQSPQ